ncbi:MAG: 50S ribosomal protein L6 [Candidatus Bathyarchaeia archaeon]
MPQLTALRTIKIPENVTVNVRQKTVEIIGEKGRAVRDFSHAPVSIRLEGDSIAVESPWPRKRETALVGTVSAHLRNMIIGVTEGFTYKLKIVFSHFPISVKVDRDKVVIDNFTGERSSRTAKIVGDTRVIVQSEDIIVQGIDIEDVSQTAANIEQATKVKKKDPRVFLDGIYIYERKRGMVE